MRSGWILLTPEVMVRLGAVILAPRATVDCGMAGGIKEHRPPTKRRGLLRSHCRRTESEAQRLGHALAIGGVGLGAIGGVVFLDVPGGLADLTGGGVELA